MSSANSIFDSSLLLVINRKSPCFLQIKLSPCDNDNSLAVIIAFLSWEGRVFIGDKLKDGPSDSSVLKKLILIGDVGVAVDEVDRVRLGDL